MERVPSLVRSVVIAMVLGGALAPTAAEARDRGERRPLAVGEADPRVELDAAAEASRLQAISMLKPLVAEARGERKAEMTLRLAELYLEEARFLQLRGMDTQRVERDRCFDTPGCDPEAVPDNADLVAAREWQERAVRFYRQILDQYPQFARADEASYSLGQTLRDLGRAEEANAELTRLVRVSPQSRFAPDAWVLVGEYWFDAGEPARAIPAYQRAAASDSDKHAFATYKLGWCYLNVGEPELAVDALVEVIRWSREHATNPDGTPARSAVLLEDEALKDLVPFVVALDDPARAERVLADVGRPDLRADLHARLAAAYAEQGRHALAIDTLRRLLAEAPLSPDAPRHADAIVASLSKLDRKDDVLAELARDRFGPGTEWARANASRPEALAEARDLRERALRGVAVTWHEEARRLRAGAQAARVYGLAERAYAAYLAEFADGAHAYDVRYGHAELLYAVRRFDLAFAEYMAVVRMDPKGAHAKFCAESAVFAAEEMAKKDADAPARGTEPVPLSEWERNELAALDQYTSLFPGAKTQSALYKSGWLLYAHNQFAEASSRFNAVIAMDPRSREAEQAAHLLLDSFALTGDWVALRDNARFYRDQPGLGSAAFKAEVAEVYEKASLKVVEARFLADGDDAAAGEGYLAFSRDFPASKQADLALHDAAVHLHAAGRFEEARQAREALVTSFPTSRFCADELAALGFDEESFARFEEAASRYEELAARFPAHPSAPDALYSAAVFRVALGDWERGVADYTRYASRWPDRPDKNRVTLAVGHLYEEHGRLGEAVAVYQRFRAKPPPGATVDEAMFARLHEGLLLRRMGQDTRAAPLWQDALAWYAEAREDGRPAELAVEYAAEMRFHLAEGRYDAFLALAIPGPGDRALSPAQTDRLLGAQLAAKVGAMRALEEAYTTVIETGSAEWGLAALSRVGAAHENLAETLRASYIPDYLTPEQRELYVLRIEDLAWAQEAQATEAYAATLARAREIDVYDTSTEWAARRLGELRPDEYSVVGERHPEARFLAPGVYVAGYEPR